MAERLGAEARAGRPGAPLLVTDKQLLEAPVQRQLHSASWTVDGYELNEHNMIEDGWQLLSIAIDSGAAETVIPHRLATQHRMLETDAS